jgi:hypothetical protein
MTTCKVNIRKVLLSQVKKLKLNLEINTTKRVDNSLYWDLTKRENHMYINFYLRPKAIYNEQLKKDLY